MNKTIIKTLVLSATLASLSLFSGWKVYAEECELDYDGRKCVVNKAYKVQKDVGIKDQGSYEDKLILDKSDWNSTIEFRIRITNTGEVETDNMKMEDFLPSELIRTGGDNLTEKWDNFESGSTKTFKIEVKLDESELDRENFDKCVVNKAEARFDGTFEGSDTATVCYGDRTVTELPETGFEEVLLPLGLGLIAVGYVIKKRSEVR